MGQVVSIGGGWGMQLGSLEDARMEVRQGRERQINSGSGSASQPHLECSISYKRLYRGVEF
jgi:hypothetical protein